MSSNQALKSEAPERPAVGVLSVGRSGRARYLALALVALVVLALPIWLDQNRLPYPIHILILIGTYAIVAQGWNILGGYAGQVSFGNAVFFGIGAYTTTLITVRLGITPWLGIPVGMVLAIVIGLLIGYYTFQLGGHYFAIATIAIGEVIQTVFINWKEVGGASGLQEPLLPSAFINFQFASRLPYFYIILAFVVIAFAVAWGVERSRLGYCFRAIKGDPLAARSLGIEIGRYKLIAMAISAAMTAAAGAFYAQYILFIDPDSVLSLNLSVLICLVAVLGGVGTIWGPLIGAMVLIPLSEGTRVYLANAGGGGKAIDLMIYGFLIILITVFQPGGLMAIIGKVGKRRGSA